MILNKSFFSTILAPLVFTISLVGFTLKAHASPSDSGKSTMKNAANDKSSSSAKAPKAEALAPGLYAEFYTTKGKIITQLEFEKIPLTVANFVGLAEGTKKSNKPAGKPFYDGLLFHRVIPNFMIQGGDPEGSGTGGPGYQFQDEFDTTLKHNGPGILSMANAGPGTNGSQFFITHVPTPHLDGRHTIFGHVVAGQEVVNAIVQNDKMDSVRIVRMGAKAKKFKGDEVHIQVILKKKGEEMAVKNKSAEAVKKAAQAEFEGLVKKAKTTPSGLKYIVNQAGVGPKPTAGMSIQVHYAGRLTDGTPFDNSYSRGKPIDFKVGTGMVIPGWDEALLDMTKGEKRTLIIPPNLAYGPQGRPPVIPENATLVFDVELVGF